MVAVCLGYCSCSMWTAIYRVEGRKKIERTEACGGYHGFVHAYVRSLTHRFEDKANAVDAKIQRAQSFPVLSSMVAI